jgi:hypothetical protein
MEQQKKGLRTQQEDFRTPWSLAKKLGNPALESTITASVLGGTHFQGHQLQFYLSLYYRLMAQQAD